MLGNFPDQIIDEISLGIVEITQIHKTTHDNNQQNKMDIIIRRQALNRQQSTHNPNHKLNSSFIFLVEGYWSR